MSRLFKTYVQRLFVCVTESVSDSIGKKNAMAKTSRRSGARAARKRAVKASKPKAGKALRRGYKGFCPLRTQQGAISGGGGCVETKHWRDLDPESFFEYVKARKPLVINTDGVLNGALGVLFGLKGEHARWALPGEQGMKAMQQSTAASCEVLVERKHAKSSFFGQSDDTAREKTTFGQFCSELEMGNELSYLTTQALEDGNGCPQSLAAEHVLQLMRGCETLRPKLIGNLIPVQYNLWFGRSSAGSSSGLHHDFHDNIYVLLRGRKEFRLFSPRCLDILAPVGVENKTAKLHSNGLISYVPGLRSDGAPAVAVREWQKRQGSKCGQHDPSDSGQSDEEELEHMLNEALRGRAPDEWSEDAPETGKERNCTNAELPDSFCRATTTSNGELSIPSLLKGRYITAALSPGDLLFLPASWFHEVISYGGDVGGHLALNLWMAPSGSPHSTLQMPYDDSFWEAFFQRLSPHGYNKPRGARRRTKPKPKKPKSGVKKGSSKAVKFQVDSPQLGKGMERKDWKMM